MPEASARPMRRNLRRTGSSCSPQPRFRRTDYDVEEAVAAIRASGYPNLAPLDFSAPDPERPERMSRLIEANAG